MRLMIDDVKIERHSMSFEAYRYEGQEVSIPLTFPDVIFASRWWWRVVEVLHPPPDGLRSWVWPQPRIAERWCAAFSYSSVKRLTTKALRHEEKRGHSKKSNRNLTNGETKDR